MKIILLIFTFLILSFNIQSQSSSIDSVSSSTINNSIDLKDVEPKVTTEYLKEKDYYKLLSENTEKAYNTNLSLFQTTLGVCLAILIAIIGSQIFFNYRINKKEIDYIKNDLDKKLGEGKTILQKRMDEKFNDESKELNKVFEKTLESNNEKFEEKFKSLEKVSALEMELIKKELKSQIKNLQHEIEKNKGDLWKLKGVESNALMSFTSSAFLQLELDREAKYTLQEIIESLKKLDEIHEFDYSRLDQLTEKSKEKYAELTKTIIDLYKDKPVYDFIRDKNGELTSDVTYLKNK